MPPCLLQTHHIINGTRNDIQGSAKKRYKNKNKNQENLKRKKKKGDRMNYTVISRKRTPAIDDIHMLLVIVTSLTSSM